MDRRLHGDDTDHPDVAASLNNLALVLRDQGDLSESARLHRESLAMPRRLHGDDTDNRDVARSLRCLAKVLRAQGDGSGSAQLRRESHAMRRRLHLAASRL
jgi:hypothetical protein